MKIDRLLRILALGALVALGNGRAASAATIPWSGSLDIDFTQAGGTNISFPSIIAGGVTINGGSAMMTPITALSITTQAFFGYGYTGASTGLFGYGLRPGGTFGGYIGLSFLSLSAPGTCSGGFSGYAACPGGGLAGFGNLFALKHKGIVGSYFATNVGGNGVTSAVSGSFGQYLIGAGWTTGQVHAYGSVYNYFSTSVNGPRTATSTGGIAGSTISLVSPLAIGEFYFGFPPFNDVMPGIARLTMNLSTVCGNGLVEPGEACDDSGVAGGDGCNATCQIEAGYSCSGAPSVCTPLATHTPVTALKLIVVDKLAASSSAKAVFVAKDAAITKGTGTATTNIGATLDFTYDNGSNPASAGQFVASTGSANWLVNKDSVAKYVNKTAPTGGGTKVNVIKPGNLVKLVGKNLGDTPIDILNQSATATGAAHTAYCVDNGPDQNCFCSTFATCSWKLIAADTGAKLVCKTGSGDPTCAALP